MALGCFSPPGQVEMLSQPLGAKGIPTPSKWTHWNPFSARAQQLSSCQSVPISGQKVEINGERGQPVVVSACWECNSRHEAEQPEEDTAFGQCQGTAPRAQEQPQPCARCQSTRA